MPLTIVTYHYVRRIKGSRYANIKGLEQDSFGGQLQYLKNHYVSVTARQVMDATRREGILPDNAVLLTFDDGYLDHFENVFPVLRKEKVHACFFPPAKCVQERTVLDINKIHHILAVVPDTTTILSAIEDGIESARHEFELESIESYMSRLAIPNRFDDARVMYIKRMLQAELPAALRSRLVDTLFRRFVSKDERSFAEDLYMNQDHLRCMADAGMTIGCHGYDHSHLDRLDRPSQELDVKLSLDFLETLGVPRKDWVMSYPHGGWNTSLLEILQRENCALGIVDGPDLARIGRNDPLLLPRLDTTDFPTVATAEPSSWTRAAMKDVRDR